MVFATVQAVIGTSKSVSIKAATPIYDRGFGVFKRDERKQMPWLYYNCDMANFETMSDEELVEEIRSKDNELYVHIVKRYESKLTRYVDYLINDRDRSADIVQGTFIKAFVNLNGFNTKKKFSSWIYRIAHNETVNVIKKFKKEVRISRDFDYPDTKDMEDEYNKKELVGRVHECLGKIPTLYSEPLALFFLDEKSYEEISDILRIPMGTVAIRISRAKALMKQLCKKIK